MQQFGYKKTIIIGLVFQFTQLTIYGLYTTKMWADGVVWPQYFSIVVVLCDVTSYFLFPV